MKESEIQRRLMQALAAKFPGIYLRKIAQGAYSRAGIPDIIGCHQGMFFGIEVKTSDGKLTKLQNLEQDHICACKGLSLVCYGIEDVPYIIERIGGL